MGKVNKTETVKADEKVPVRPAENQYNRYNMTLPQSFSVYNDEGSVVYRGEVEQMANLLRAELFGIEPSEVAAPVKEEKAETEKKKKKVRSYTKKRGFFLVLPVILAVVVLAVAVCGLFDTPITEYISIYNHTYVVKTDFPLLDPVISFIGETFGVDTGALPTAFGESFVSGGEDFGAQLVKYALPVAIVVYLVFALIMLIVAIVGLAGKKREDGTYNKARLGFLSIIMFLCSLIIAVCGLSASGTEISALLEVLSGKNDFGIGYAMYVLIAVPVITFICTCLAYGKDKKNEEKSEKKN